MSTFAEFIVALEKRLISFASDSLGEWANEAQTDAKMFLIKWGGQLNSWTEQLSLGELTRDDFDWLVNGLKDTTRMEQLEASGLAQLQIEQFVNDILQITVETALKFFLPA